MENLFYNIGTQSLDAGLNDIEIASGLDYLIILDAPSNANIKVRLGSNTAPQIPLKDGWQIETINVDKIYLSCDVVAGGRITYGQADGNIKIQPNPTINSIDSITELGGMSTALINALGKELNPYDEENSTIIESSSSTSTQTTIINTTLDCDKIIIRFAQGFSFNATSGSYARMYLRAKINGHPVAILGSYANSPQDQFIQSKEMTFKNVRGKTLEVESATALGVNYCQIEKINLKA